MMPDTMPWKTAGVMGLGLSGIAASCLLARRGVRVIACDDKPLAQLTGEAAELHRLGVTLRCGTGGADVFKGCDVVIASPGVPASSLQLASARAAGARVMAEVELASRFLSGELIGITGSNGKSTVTALIGEILKTAGIPARVCGNFGTPLTAVAEADLALPPSEARAVRYVVELSSFQLEGIETLRPRIAILLNLSPDHQDRYSSSGDYFAAKARIFMNQMGDDIAIVNWDDAPSRELTERLAARLFPFSLTQDMEEGAVSSGGRLVLRRQGGEEVFMSPSEVPIPGRHNLENVLAAAAAAAHSGVAAAAIAKAVRGFRGLPHRLEFVMQVAGVSYYNDSKATNVGATLRALESFEAPIVLLLGGYDKGGDFDSLRGPISWPGRIRTMVTFGKAGDDIARRLEGAAPKTLRCGSLVDAVKAAAGAARPGDIVLLAPGCASFDAYTGFDKRGEDFRAHVKLLASQAGGLS